MFSAKEEKLKKEDHPLTDISQPLPAEYVHWRQKAGWFLSSQAVSLFGSSITQFAIVWYVTLSTSSGVMIMLSSLCSFLPQILISLFAGVWADRHNRKYLVMISDGAIALSTLILAVIFLCGYQELWLLFLVAAVRSAGTGVQTPAVTAMIPQIVPQEKLMRINGLNSTIQSLTMLVSPAVSGAVLSMAGLEAAFFIDVVTAGIAIVIMSRLKVAKVKREEEEMRGAFADLKFGLTYAWNHRFLRVFLFFYAGLMFLVTPAALLTPLLTTRTFGEEVWMLTANEMLWSFGTVIGGLIIAAWGGFRNRLNTLVMGTVVFGIFTMLLGFAGVFVVYLCFLFLTGLSMPFVGSPGMVLLQETVEPQMQGRVFGLVQIVSSSALPLGMAIFGPLADVVSVEWLLVITGILMALLGVSMLLCPSLREAGRHRTPA